MDDVQHRLARAIGAGARGFALVTQEEDRAHELLEAVGEALGFDVHTWSAASGTDLAGRPEPLDALFERLRPEGDGVIWALDDLGPLLHDPARRRAIREFIRRPHGPVLVLVGEALDDLSGMPELDIVPLPLPDEAELLELFERTARALAKAGMGGAATALRTDPLRLARATLGLELRAVERLVREAAAEGVDDPRALERFLVRAKPAGLDRAGLLERLEPVPANELGGLETLKGWVRQRALALDPRAREAGIPNPRGILLLGVQGCGKSLAARACADLLELPLLRLDPGRLFAQHVGQSEANLRRVTETVERIAPVVLWIDEIDKGMAGAQGAQSDAGTASRVVGGLLTWLQERQRPVFVVATANRIDTLPPELLRRGRLDEIFFVDLPDARAREAILRVHLEQVPTRTLGRVPPTDDPWERFAEVAHAADGYSGAELESALVEARLRAFAEDRPLRAADLAEALGNTVPLSRSRAESVAALRAWAQPRARLA